MSELVRRYQSLSLYSFPVLILVMVVVPLLMWGQSTDDISIYFKYETPPGQIYYVASKLAGLYAIALLWLQVILALYIRIPMGQKLPLRNIKSHRNLGVLAFSALILHAALFVVAVSIRKAHFAYGVLFPDFNHGFYNMAVSLGVLALYGLIVVVATGYLRRRGVQRAKWFHRVSIVALILTLVHCLLIGSETRYYLMITVYAFMIGTLTIALYSNYKYAQEI